MRTHVLAALAAAGLIAGIASAQTPAPPPPPPGFDPAQAAASRADDMTLLLGLRPDQRQALNDFLGAMTPQQDGDREAMMQARMAATQRFRATLAPDQQARLDALERLRHGISGGMGRGGRGHWGGGQSGQ
jgi:hypothetical protein